MSDKFIDYSLLSDTSNVEDVLRDVFKCSSSRLKKYFPKQFLSRSLKKHSTLKLPLNFTNDGYISPSYCGEDLNILFEDQFFLVFEKMPNQFIHPLTYDEADNCLSWLRLKRPELLSVNKAHYDRGLLYRLDYETSGVVVYAKTDDVYIDLRERFNETFKVKKYLAWVKGHCLLNGRYKHGFKSRDEKGKRVVVNDELIGDIGELDISFREYDKIRHQTLIEVSLVTGLRHQIRAQLSFLGHPLIGDPFYGGPAGLRLYLHAHKYQFSYLNKDYIFESNPQHFKGL